MEDVGEGESSSCGAWSRVPRLSSMVWFSPSRTMWQSGPIRILTLSSLSGVFAGEAGAAEAPPEDIMRPKGRLVGRFILSATTWKREEMRALVSP